MAFLRLETAGTEWRDSGDYFLFKGHVETIIKPTNADAPDTQLA